ncbi:16S rRNA (cytosine(967)-C(5))-methyltransferase RsmB [Acidithiobacillus sp. CV18-2]|uniref:16S rRNA (cytosine(967)-C(5))-methyltransferase n=1 Tax=Igneacidithiobacillus copahuensis TaxID=2724909 RepID=A0AAE3CIW6_9PROT|nr:16S rRNA (cytosine(967)-C(5))-methyltransferase RsmB [Igneacidithiobacillus copahuensis]MBU2754551.1 16S rRNA (cytosine(967)-C(5))-methyltransferase RsmB [Acidithiobacillus sp. CV18-3]MBU2757287.1 16S rRNA (cytosine(967)-C(5))-methyltransferase RsmB [Acidithiobacillus sp. BN09-2]MBU2776856.1 16S rRNA (cytosine(967)-C(5))-methyltransferase RsmB [Acidithiobacillus sp. CV18-2]MBU2796283.1 16S rRNA (cytosine(967)-C(5))-methyltransferase RsmB [Acidithiobacillus sp. VAN18-2]MBU2799414.1 16S rRNA 
MSEAVQGKRLRRAALLAYPAALAGERLDFLLDRSGLQGAERASLQWLLSGALREGQALREPLQSLLRPGKQDEQVLALLQLALYELRHGQRPDFAIVNDWVEASQLIGKTWAKGLINAVLRRYLRERSALDTVAASPSESHPAWLLQRLQAAYPEDWPAIVAANLQPAPLWLRVNRQQLSRDAYQRRLQECGHPSRTYAQLPDALILPGSLPVRELPGWDAGWVTVQDGAAQLAAEILAPQRGEKVLDACAAPGGKTAHLLALGATNILALDRSAPRLRRLQEALQRQGLSAELREADAALPETWGNQQLFDAILLDAPCSATGIIRRHPDILHREPDLVALRDEQARLLRGLWQQLRPGGRLLYCTCSILPEENEAQIQDFLAGHSDAVRVADPRCGQRLPGQDDMDGFYYALLRKVGTQA